jgi:hypothetical protein
LCADTPWKAGCELLPDECGPGDADAVDRGGILAAPCDEADCNPGVWGTVDGSVLAGSIEGTGRTAWPEENAVHLRGQSMLSQRSWLVRAGDRR